jgi:RNA-directed DNA polymerase
MPPLAKGAPVPEPLQLMERVVERSNMQRACNRVKQNKGAAGVDGVSVSQMGSFLRAHWPKIKERLCEGAVSKGARSQSGTVYPA